MTKGGRNIVMIQSFVLSVLLTGCADRTLARGGSADLADWRLWSGLLVLLATVFYWIHWLRTYSLVKRQGGMNDKLFGEILGNALAPLFELLVIPIGFTIFGEWGYRIANWVHGWGLIGNGILICLALLGGGRGLGLVSSYFFYMWLFPDTELATLVLGPMIGAAFAVIVLAMFGVEMSYAKARKAAIAKRVDEFPGA